MKKYNATYMTAAKDENGNDKYEFLGTKEFLFFAECGVSAMSKAFKLADRKQQQANEVTLTEIEL